MRVFGRHWAALLTLLAGAASIISWWVRPGVLTGQNLPVLPETFFDRDAPRWIPEAFLPWPEPTRQSAGPRWIFEIFTPPLIYYNPTSGRFTVEPPLPAPEEPPFGVYLSRLEREPFRFQYAGHSGEAGRYFVEIQDLQKKRYHRVRVGDRIAESRWVVDAFLVGRRDALGEAGSPDISPRSLIELVLVNEDTAAVTSLGRETLYKPGLRAVLVGDTTGKERRLAVGEAVELDAHRFAVRSVDVDARTVEVSKLDSAGNLLMTERLIERSLLPAETAGESAQ